MYSQHKEVSEIFMEFLDSQQLFSASFPVSLFLFVFLGLCVCVSMCVSLSVCVSVSVCVCLSLS